MLLYADVVKASWRPFCALRESTGENMNVTLLIVLSLHQQINEALREL